MEVSLVQGLLTQHVMQNVAAQAFSPSSVSADTIAGWRKGLVDAGDGVSPDTESCAGWLVRQPGAIACRSAEGCCRHARASGSTATAAGATPNAGGLRQPFSIEKAVCRRHPRQPVQRLRSFRWHERAVHSVPRH